MAARYQRRRVAHFYTASAKSVISKVLTGLSK